MTAPAPDDAGVEELERRIRLLEARLAEAIDYVDDAVRHWPVNSEEHRVAVAIFGRCQAALPEIETAQRSGRRG